MLRIVLKRATQQKGAQVEDYVITYVVFFIRKSRLIKKGSNKGGKQPVCRCLKF